MSGTTSRVSEKQLRKARVILARSIPLGKYLRDIGVVYSDAESGKARCPVHDESTPSFFYDGVKQKCNCFGCGIGGTVAELHFHIQKKNNDKYSLLRSIKDLAKQYNVDIPDLYEDVLEEDTGIRPSTRKRGHIEPWIYKTKLRELTPKLRSLPLDVKYKAYCLIDDTWLGEKTDEEVYHKIMKLIKEVGSRGSNQEEYSQF